MRRQYFLAWDAVLLLLAGCISVKEREFGAVRVVTTSTGACCSAEHHSRLVSSRGGELLDHLGGYVVSGDGRWMVATRSKEGEKDPHLYVIDLQEGIRKASVDLPGNAYVWQQALSPDGRRLFFDSDISLPEGGRESALLVARFGQESVTVEPLFRERGSIIRFLPFLGAHKTSDGDAFAFLTIPSKPDQARPSCTLFKLTMAEPPVVTEIEKTSESEWKVSITWEGDRPHLITR